MVRSVCLGWFMLCSLWLSGPGLAQSKAGDKEWQEILNAAKREGRVVVAGSPDPVMRNEVIPKFTARTGIALEFIAGRSSQIVYGSKRKIGGDL